MASRLGNLSYAFRRISKSPGVALAAILSIGLGIGANATIFSMVSRFVLRPAPVGDPATLLRSTPPTRRAMLQQLLLAALHRSPRPGQIFLRRRRLLRTRSRIHRRQTANPSASGDRPPPPTISTSLNSPWRSAAASSPPRRTSRSSFSATASGSTASPPTPPSSAKPSPSPARPSPSSASPRPTFRGIDLVLAPQFWVPLGNVEQLALNLPDRSSRDFHWLAVIGRVKPGVTRAQAAAELDTLAANFAKANPATDKDNGFPFDQAGSLPPNDRSTVLMFSAR